MVPSNNVFLALTIFIALITNVTCLFFQTTSLAGFELDIDIGASETTITARVDTSQQFNWHGIGFDGIKMQNTYGIIQEFALPPTFSIRHFGKSSGGGADPRGTEEDATASNWVTNFNAASNPIIITLTRANNVGLPFYVFNPALPTLDIIYAYGKDTLPFMDMNSGHTPTTRVVETLNYVSTAPTTSPFTDTPTTSPFTGTPTASPSTGTPTTATPTTATPTTSTPTTASPTTATPTSASPTTSTPTTATPTAVTTTPTSAPTANASLPTTATPTVQSTIAYTTDIPTTSTPTSASPSHTASSTLVTSGSSTASTYTGDSSTTTIVAGDSYPAGVNGYIQHGQDWVNDEATQLQLLLICAAFATFLVCCLCCCYFVQYRKTKKLKKTLFSFQPNLLQNEREKGNGKNYGDIPFVDAVDPESSLGHHHNYNGDVVLAAASAADDNVLDVAPPDDEEANFRKPNPNNDYRIPEDVENKLEESLSVDISDEDKVLDMFAAVGDVGVGDVGMGAVAPPPPSEPIPDDILQEHRARSVTQLPQPKNERIDRRYTYQPGVKQKSHKSELELQSMPLYQNAIPDSSGMERVRTQSQMDADEDPPTPVSDDHDMLMEAEMQKYRKHENANSGSAKALPFASKRNNNDPALSLLSDQAMISEAPPQKRKINIDVNNQENEEQNYNNHLFDALSSPSAKMLFAEPEPENEQNIDAAKDPFSSIEAEFNALANEMEDLQEPAEPPKEKHKAEQSGNDMILDMLDSEVSEPPKVVDMGNAAVLDIFSAEPEPPQPQPQPPSKADTPPPPLPPSSEPEPQHRGKQVEDDPFASLDMSPTDLFSVNVADVQQEAPPAEPERKEIDSNAMGILGGLMSANPEFGDNDNIFGGGAGTQSVDAILNATGPTSNIIDFAKYTNVAAPVAIDYDALTKISDTDQYKVVSVQETVVVDDGDGHVQESINPIQQNNGLELRELEDILQENMVDASGDNVQIIAQNLDKMEAELNMSSPLDMLMGVDDNNNDISVDNETDPFGPLDNAYDPFAALNASSPLDNIMNAPVDNEGDAFGKKEAAMQHEYDPFAALNVSSPLDDIMNDSTNKENMEQTQEENDPFAALTSSPLDAIMNQSNDNEENEENDPFAALNVSSPLDDIMGRSTDNNNDNDAGFNQLSSPLDHIMNESTERTDVVGFNQLSSPLDSMMSASSVSSDQSTPVTSPDNIGRLMKPNPMGHQTIDLDSFMQASANMDSQQPVMYNEEIKEDEEEEEEDEDDDEEASMGSEIIHDSPRHSEIVHEALNPEIFGKEDGDDSSSDGYTDGTDPMNIDKYQ